MNSQKLDPFQFSNMLDNKFLNELFDGDTEYAGVVFEDFLTNISQFWNEVEQAAASKEPLALKAAVHKTKTLFGYVGHSAITSSLHRFEDQCSRALSFVELTKDFELLSAEKDQAVNLVSQESARLQEYLRQNAA